MIRTTGSRGSGSRNAEQPYQSASTRVSAVLGVGCLADEAIRVVAVFLTPAHVESSPYPLHLLGPYPSNPAITEVDIVLARNNRTQVVITRQETSVPATRPTTRTPRSFSVAQREQLNHSKGQSSLPNRGRNGLDHHVPSAHVHRC